MNRHESKLWQNLNGECKRLAFYRIDRPVIPGMPDVHFLTEFGFSGWIELKSVETISSRVEVTAIQADWAKDYQARGGVSLLLVEVRLGRANGKDSDTTPEYHIFKKAEHMADLEGGERINHLPGIYWQGKIGRWQEIERNIIIACESHMLKQARYCQNELDLVRFESKAFNELEWREYSRRNGGIEGNHKLNRAYAVAEAKAKEAS